MNFLPVAGPLITAKEIAYVTDAVTNAWFDQAYSYCKRFETAFAAYCGRRYAFSLPSCTSALHLALAALNIGPGDEVIVPDATWIATAAPITYAGATPIFADIAPDSWCLSVSSVERCLTSRTRAIIAVDLYGSLPDMCSLSSLAQRHGLALIEDAAQAVSSTYQGRRAGGFGDVSTFSFHGSKTLTTGEGGMLLTDRDDIYERVGILRDHGRQPGDTRFWNTEVGFKYKMTEGKEKWPLPPLRPRYLCKFWQRSHTQPCLILTTSKIFRARHSKQEAGLPLTAKHPRVFPLKGRKTDRTSWHTRLPFLS